MTDAAEDRREQATHASSRAGGTRSSNLREIEALREELERRVQELAPRWNADPEDVQRSVARSRSTQYAVASLTAKPENRWRMCLMACGPL